MKKLKTLKEIITSNEPCGQDDYIEAPRIKEDLRKEAIKWIKEYRDEDYNNSKVQSTFHFQDNTIAIPVRIQRDGMIEWVKHFFNLTEEDLL